VVGLGHGQTSWNPERNAPATGHEHVATVAALSTKRDVERASVRGNVD